MNSAVSLIVLKQGYTLSPAYNEFGYSEHAVTTSRLLYVKVIDNNVKKLGYNEPFVLQLFARSKDLFILKRKQKHFQMGSQRIQFNVHIDQRKTSLSRSLSASVNQT